MIGALEESMGEVNQTQSVGRKREKWYCMEVHVRIMIFGKELLMTVYRHLYSLWNLPSQKSVLHCPDDM